MKMEDRHQKVVLTLSYEEAERIWIALGNPPPKCYFGYFGYTPTKAQQKTVNELIKKLDEYCNS